MIELFDVVKFRPSDDETEELPASKKPLTAFTDQATIDVSEIPQAALDGEGGRPV